MTITLHFKLLFFMPFALLLFSCHTEGSDQQPDNSNDVINVRKIDPILNEIFINKYPNFKENSIVRDQANLELTHQIDSLVHLGYLDDIPLKVLRIQDLEDESGVLVQFYASNKHSGNELLSSSLEFEIFGLMSREKASTINESLKYKVSAKNFKRLTNEEAFVLVPNVQYGAKSLIFTSDPRPSFLSGIFLCEVEYFLVAD